MKTVDLINRITNQASNLDQLTKIAQDDPDLMEAYAKAYLTDRKHPAKKAAITAMPRKASSPKRSRRRSDGPSLASRVLDAIKATGDATTHDIVTQIAPKTSAEKKSVLATIQGLRARGKIVSNLTDGKARYSVTAG